MRIALVADWLTTYGGAEHVLQELTHMFPGAPLYTTLARRQGLGPLAAADIRTTKLQRWYGLLRQHQVLLPWMPKAIESIDLRGYDVVLSSSHAVGKGVIVQPGTVHICYCHTPIRYAWEMEDQYLDDFRVPTMLRKPLKRQLSKIRRWDMATSKRVDVFIANSTTTQERIRRIYGRESTVIPPPVDDRFFQDARHETQDTSNDYFLAVGRLVPYKRFDLLIQAANETGMHLKIAGRGQDEARLKTLAGPTVEFLGFVPEEELPSLYRHAKALLFPQYEDAGIVALEAQATGTPVVAYRAGGAIDTVRDGVTGLFFDEQTLPSLLNALTRFATHSWKRDAITAHAKQFSQAIFKTRIEQLILTACAAPIRTKAKTVKSP
jgi:glycosyltransferase involved in cell wall biosynthesis